MATKDCHATERENLNEYCIACIYFVGRDRIISENRLLASSRPHVSARLPPDGFSWNFTFWGTSRKSVEKLKHLVKIARQYWALYLKTCPHLLCWQLNEILRSSTMEQREAIVAFSMATLKRYCSTATCGTPTIQRTILYPLQQRCGKCDTTLRYT